MAATFSIVIDAPNALYFYDKRKLKATMRSAGTEVMAAAKALLKQGGSGRLYYGSGGTRDGYRPYKRGKFRASAPGQSPSNVTRTLYKSLKVFPYPSGEGVAVRATAFYGLFLEEGASGGIGSGLAGVKGSANPRFNVPGSRGRQKIKLKNVGTRVLTPRPFLSVALAAKHNSLTDRIVAAVEDGVKFVRQKP